MMEEEEKVKSPPQTVFADLAGLSTAWDNCQQLRERIRQTGRVVVAKPAEDKKEETPGSVLGRTMANVRHNGFVLSPLLKMMADRRDMVPCLNALAVEIRQVLEKSGMVPSHQTLQDQSWSLRYLYGLVKQQLYKEKPPGSKDKVMLDLLHDFGVDVSRWPRGKSTDGLPAPSQAPKAKAVPKASTSTPVRAKSVPKETITPKVEDASRRSQSAPSRKARSEEEIESASTPSKPTGPSLVELALKRRHLEDMCLW